MGAGPGGGTHGDADLGAAVRAGGTYATTSARRSRSSSPRHPTGGTSWSRDLEASVEVRLDGPAGPQTLELPLMPQGGNLPFGCNQVSHGC